MKLAKQPCMRVFLGVLVDSLSKGFWTCTSQFLPWVLQKKTHFRNTSWLLQKSSKEKMTSKEMLMKSWPSHDIFLTHVMWKSMTIQETVVWIHRILRWFFPYRTATLAGHAGTLWQWRVCNSNVLGLHPFAAHLTDPSGVVEVEQVAIEKFGITGMKGPRRCLSSISFDKQYDCWFYGFSMMTAQHIRNYKKNQHIWNSLAPRMPGVVKRLPFRVFSSPQDQLRASELRSSGGNNFSQAEVDELSILFHEGPPTDESEEWLNDWKTPQLLACWLFLPTQNGSKMMLLVMLSATLLQTVSVCLFGVTLLY